MGQYYFPLLIGKRNKRTTAYSHKFGAGLKLMEHSWVGSDFVNAVMKQLYNNPQRVAWVGDYSDSLPFEKYVLGDGFITSREQFMRKYKAAMERVNSLPGDSELLPFDVTNNKFFLVNETKGLYIDLEDYVQENTSDGWCINPLPLLTCIGNGLGGGDYWGNDGPIMCVCPGSLELEYSPTSVGTWCFDRIQVVDKISQAVNDYKQVRVCFEENW